MVNKVNFLGHEVSRLIGGDNPMTGHSYIQDTISGQDMRQYYTAENVKKAFDRFFELGINTMCPLSDPYIVRLLREYQEATGNRIQCIWQPWTPLGMYEGVSWIPEDLNTIATYHQGTTTDYLREKGDYETIKENIKKMKELGVPVGLGTHYPDMIERCEEEDWGADFYMACLHNARRGREGEQSGFITGKSKQGIKFFPEDRPIMLNTLRQVDKPIIAFKIFAGGQIFINKTEEEVRQTVKDVYEEVFSALKPNDIAAMGVFQRDNDQITQNIKMYEEWYAEKNK